MKLEPSLYRTIVGITDQLIKLTLESPPSIEIVEKYLHKLQSIHSYCQRSHEAMVFLARLKAFSQFMQNAVDCPSNRTAAIQTIELIQSCIESE